MNKRKLLILFLIFILSFLLSLMIGQTFISFPEVLTYLIHSSYSDLNHIIIETSRLPRTVVSVLVGANLSVAGILMQSFTRNPIAAPGILGINASAMFFIVVLSSFFNFDSFEYYLWSAFLGAFFSGALVWLLSTMGSKEINPLRMVLAGAALTALFYSFTQAFLIINKEGLEDILFWLAGSVSNKDLDLVMPILPYSIVALIGSFFLSRHMNILSLGDESAKSLGQNIKIIRIFMVLFIVVLAGSSVAIAGSVGFIGLVVPHIVKYIFSSDNRFLIPASILLGANIVLISDIIARTIIIPREVPIGIMTALIGAPFFIYLILTKRKYG